MGFVWCLVCVCWWSIVLLLVFMPGVGLRCRYIVSFIGLDLIILDLVWVLLLGFDWLVLWALVICFSFVVYCLFTLGVSLGDFCD